MLDSSSEDGLLTSLLGQDGARFVLSVRVVGQFRGAGGDWALQDGLLQVVKHSRVLFGEEGHGHTTLTRTTSTTDTMDVVWRGNGRSNGMNANIYRNVHRRTAGGGGTRLRTFDVLRHVVVEDHGDVLDVDTSTSDVCGNQDVFSSCFEVGQGELSLLLAFTAVQRAGVVLQQEPRGQTLLHVIDIPGSVKPEQLF